MTTWRIRDFQTTDLDALLRIWQQHRRQVSDPVYALGEVIASTRKDPPSPPSPTTRWWASP